MKLVLTTIAIASTLTLVGCNKTKKVTAAHVSPPASDVDVEVDENQLVVVDVEAEFRKCDLKNSYLSGRVMSPGLFCVLHPGGDADADVNGDGMVNVSDFLQHIPSLMMGGEHGDMGDMDGKYEIHMIMNGEEVEGLPDEIMEHVTEMMRQGFHMPEGMNLLDAHRRNDGYGEGHGDHGIPEEHQFMEELRMFNAVSEHLGENEAVAIMGIHMIRDQLEGEVRLEALEEIINGAEEGSPARNAALIVAIETLSEEGEDDRVADLMVELVLSN